MSLVTNPQSIIIENGDLLDDLYDEGISREEERLLAAFREIRGMKLHGVCNSMEVAGRGGLQRSRGAAQQRQQRQEHEEKEEARRENMRQTKPRHFDPKALDRLNVSTVASRARSQKKYIDQLKESKAQKKLLSPRAVSPTATKAGLRLYAAAMGCQRRRENRRAEQERLQKEDEEKMTFQPQISSFAKQLGCTGYVPLHERFNHTREKLAKDRLLRESERMNRVMAGCTFHPTLAVTSRKMAARRRKSEPFSDAGERLFFEGGSRLIRQQLRERIFEELADSGVIGDFQISNEAAEELVLRLWNWQETADRNREAAQREYVQRATKPSSSRYRCVPQPQQDQKLSHNHTCPSSLTSKSLPPSENKVLQRLPEDDLRRIRCRALFSKYASSEDSTSVQLAEVKRQVRELFPEDSSIVVALTSRFVDAEEFSKTDFVDSLMRFEQLHGPQPWGNPKWAHAMSVAEEPPLFFSSSCSVTQCQAEAEATSLGNLQRSNLTHAIPLARKRKTEMNDGMLSCSSSYRRAPSATFRRGSSGEAFNDLQSSEQCPHKGQQNVTQSMTMQNVRERTAEHAAREKRRQSLEQNEAIQPQKHEELSTRQRGIPREVPNTRDTQERSSSLGSVELSSITEECGSTPSAKRPDEIVTELEALIATPLKRSVTASPKRPSSQCGPALHGDVVSCLPSSLRRRAQNVPVPRGARDVGYTKVKEGHLTRQQLLKEVEQVLGVGAVTVAID
ncbi:hypothetical protein TraAM80_04267 [Trypanosoma rangeli]|uniref:Uncharacterized protein n=1 Tax=Trypanosoma rangeli TaxID=5698 RepID=A0A422NK50_TRYRA|nr:uncharacterized protein TraAM80_04267 [Trypanosoma rangeli]RNF05888.1 hypothetical protein TraAM80_04267 [Trypanosoma rangeli]|eukprot:RNF05888.1 hypothetical protein TraAM80_04267 [Trypanosoma rangeli]